MRKVSKKDAEKFAKDNDLLFEEASALSSKNISDIFEKLIEEIYEKRNLLQNNTLNNSENNLDNTLSKIKNNN